MDRLKFRLAIITLGAVAALAFWGRVRAADNMCNVASWVAANGPCDSQQEWERGWGAARESGNSGAVPTQTEYTNANDDKDPNTPGIQVEVIRHAGESGVGDPGDGKRNRGGITVETGQVAADFGGRSGVWGEYGRACQGSSGVDARVGDISGVCTGTIKIYSCSPGQITTRPGESAPICLNQVGQINGAGDCVAEANRRCAFVQLDVQTDNPLSGSAITCYPSDYSQCGGARVGGPTVAMN